MNPVWFFLNGVPVIPILQTGVNLAGDGSATAPSYSFASEPDLGFFRAAADTIGYSYSSGTNPLALAGNAVQLGSGTTLSWSSTTLATGSQDISLSRGAANLLNLNGALAHTGSNGQAFTGLQSLTELTTIAAAATTDTTIQMPAGAIVMAVSVRVTVVIPTAATFTVGDSGSAARFNTGASVSAAANTTDAGTKAGAYYNASALSVRITPNATPAANTGRVRVTIWYFTSTPPTS